MPRTVREPLLPMPIPGGARLPARRDQDARWAQLDARRPHASNLTASERIEFERLDIARHHRQLRKGLA
jgi:hypothetical protein